MPCMWRVEFHCHTSFSGDCLLSPGRLVECGLRKGLDRIIITDHNTIAGALSAQRLFPEAVIVGEEILTTKGELLAAFVQEEVPAGLSPVEAVARLRGQGAFISVSHPFDAHRNGAWHEADLTTLFPLVDAIETFNSRCLERRHNLMASRFAQKNSLPGTVGSDAHTCWELGRSTLSLPEFHSADDLRRAIGHGRPSTRSSPPWIHLSSRYAVFRKRLNRIHSMGESAP